MNRPPCQALDDYLARTPDPNRREGGLRVQNKWTHTDSAEQPLWYNAADAFAYPSLYEGFGLPPLEAMACGVPVITSDRASLPEVVGDAGRLVDPERPDALAAALAEVLSDESTRARMRQAGLARARRFTWEAMGSRLLDA